MTIVRFRYHDTRRGWRLEETRFGAFNLLVGISGVGKTSIINALRKVRAAGLSMRAGKKLEAEWAIELNSEGKSYYWEAQTTMSGAPVKGDDREGSESRSSRFIHERITIDGHVLVDRSSEQFLFVDQKLPKLKDTESAIALLEAEETVAPLQRALQRVLFSDIDSFGMSTAVMFVEKRSLAEAEKETASSLDALRAEYRDAYTGQGVYRVPLSQRSVRAYSRSVHGNLPQCHRCPCRPSAQTGPAENHVRVHHS